MLRTETANRGRRSTPVFAFGGTLVLLGAMTPMSQGCSFVIGDGDVSGLDSGFVPNPPPPDAGSVTPNACNECIFQGCRGSYAVCANDSECFTIYQCATRAACDAACVDACYTAGTPRGQREYYALAACDNVYACSTCGAECRPAAGSCAEAPPADAGTAPPDAGAPELDAGTVQDCQGCTNSKCADEKTACGPATQCDAYSQCLNGCADVPCIDKCAVDFAAGKSASAALSTCVQTWCSNECGLSH